MSFMRYATRKAFKSPLIFAAICGFAAAAPIASSAAEARPALHNAAYAVEVRQGNIQIVSRRTHEPVFSVARLARAEYEILRAQSGLSASDRETPFQVRQSFTLVSFYGPFLALRDQTLIEQGSGALPGGGVRYWTIDLRHPENLNLDPKRPLAALLQPDGAIMSLATLYAPPQMTEALAHDPFVRKFVTPRAGQSPQSVLDALSHATLTNPKICLDAPRDMLSRFAIVSATPSTLGIRLGLPGRASCRGNLTNLGLTLPLLKTIRTEAGPDARVMSAPRDAGSVTIVEGHAPPETQSNGGQFSPARQ